MRNEEFFFLHILYVMLSVECLMSMRNCVITAAQLFYLVSFFWYHQMEEVLQHHQPYGNSDFVSVNFFAGKHMLTLRHNMRSVLICNSA